MSEMSSMLYIPLYRDAPSHHEPNEKKGDGRSGRSRREKPFPLSFSSLREEPWAAWMDAQYAAHAAHAVDPSVLNACRPMRNRTSMANQAERLERTLAQDRNGGACQPSGSLHANS